MKNGRLHEPSRNPVLIIYYSYDGNTRLMAESMAEAIQGDLLSLMPKKEMTKRGFSKYFWGGSQVMMKRKPDLMPLPLDPASYEVVFIGTPVWAWTYAPPIATLLKTVDFSGKKIALFSCHGGQNGKTFENLKKELASSQLLGEIDFFEPVTRDTEIAVKRAKDWAKEMVARSENS